MISAMKMLRVEKDIICVSDTCSTGTKSKGVGTTEVAGKVCFSNRQKQHATYRNANEINRTCIHMGIVEEANH